MQKRKSLFSIVLTVLVLALAVSMLVACNQDKPKYTLTFDDGSVPAQTVTLEEGTAITAEQIPAAKEIEGKTFDGWYDGETKVEAGYKFTKNVTVIAKYSTVKVTVKFVNGDDEESVEIDYNTAIAADKLPSDVQPADSRIFEFDGWYDGETKFASDMTFKEDATFTAQFERIAYIVTIKNDAAGKDPIEEIVAKNPNGVTVLPAGLLPSMPAVGNKISLGYYNGAIKMSAGATITDDLTLVACYVGEDDYSGVWVDETKKVVAIFDEDDDTLYVGKKETYISNLTFDTQLGKMEYITYSFSTSYTLSIQGDTMTVTLSSSSSSTTYKMTKVTDDVLYKGTYLRNDPSQTLKIFDGGYALVDYYGIDFSYAKLALIDGEYKFIACKDEGDDADIIDASIVNVGDIPVISIDGLSIVGIWVRGSDIEFKMSDEDNSTYLIKHDVDGTYIYVFVDEDGVYSVVRPDIDEIVENMSGVVELAFEDGSTRFIKVYYGDYKLAGAESGTYTVVGGVANRNLILDGFGTAKFNDAENTYAYEVIGENQIYIEEFNIGYKLNGETCSEVEKDMLDGVFHQLNNSYYDRVIIFNGYGSAVAKDSIDTIYSDEIHSGTYTINKQDNTVTITGIESDYFKDGVYEILFDGETLCLNGKYYGKEAESKLEIMEGKWIDNADNTIVITSSIVITVNDDQAGNIEVLKYDKSAYKFQADGEIYTIVLGDAVNGRYTLKASVNNVDTVYTAAPAAISALFGEWANSDETIKVVVEDKYTVKVDFDATEDTLVDADLIASNATDKTLTVKVNGVSYIIQLVNTTTIQIDSTDNTYSVELNKPLISNSELYGSWTWDDSRYEDMVPVIGELEISADEVKFKDENGDYQEVTNVVYIHNDPNNDGADVITFTCCGSNLKAVIDPDYSSRIYNTDINEYAYLTRA